MSEPQSHAASDPYYGAHSWDELIFGNTGKDEYEALLAIETHARRVASVYATTGIPGPVDAGLTRLKDALDQLDEVRNA